MVEFVEDDSARAVPVRTATAEGTPWHLWAVGVVSLLWNAFGANDYLQTQLGNLAYFETMLGGMEVTPAQAMAYFQSFPVGVTGFWALGVWGAVAGSILLLLRTRLAVWAFAGSLIGLGVNTLYQLLTPQPDWIDSSTPMTIVIWSVATFLLIHAISMRGKGVLR
ncbi:hypothetical protein [Qipengyuania sp.]|uniref:hypothetical protein n=1 Tax=Qipengyuania sp. TaxID=2004515 RepID=UPI0035C873B2